MDATMILIDSDAELARARALVDRLWNSNDPTDIVRLEAQARPLPRAGRPAIAAAEEGAIPASDEAGRCLSRALIHPLVCAMRTDLVGGASA